MLLSSCYNRQAKVPQSFWETDCQHVSKLTVFFDPEILPSEINPKEHFRSHEISFMHKDVHCGIFMRVKNWGKNLDDNTNMVYYGTSIQRVITKLLKYKFIKMVLKRKTLAK